MFWIKPSRKIALFNPSKVFYPLSFNPLQQSQGGETEAQPGLQGGRFPDPASSHGRLPALPPLLPQPSSLIRMDAPCSARTTL